VTNGISGVGRSLDAFANGVDGVTDVLSVAGDGRCVAACSRLGRDEIDRLAANLAMLNALTTGAAQYLGGRAVLNVAVQNGNGYLVAMKVDELHVVAVRADRSCDIEQVVYELCRLCDHLAATHLSGRDTSAPGLSNDAWPQ
jgi:predicted regulator of Ras-like GTPase activity (Roadblock/LC7/MglB family)